MKILDSTSLTSSLILDSNSFNNQFNTFIGGVRYSWDGANEKALPMKTGEIPGGYINGPAFRIYKKGVHSPNYLSYGPYVKPDGSGELSQIYIFCVADNFGGGNEPIATFDLVDHAAGGRNIVNPVTVKVSDLHGIKVFGIFLSAPIEVNQNMEIENRIFVHGGSDLSFFQMHWYISYI
ncbi:hypothetical protein [Bacillus cereus]|uniref:hypothetical protein n=1 Tax=Bacillus cereus TaxID=1396 RepID=UPI001F1ACB03|nr:hypothetical protein [Bacillus cereus]